MASPTQWKWVWLTLGVGDGQGSLVCCGSWGHKESDTTEWLNWTELNQVVNQSVVAFPDEISLDRIFTAHWICCVAIKPVNIILFVQLVKNKNKNKTGAVCSCLEVKHYTFTVFLRVWSIFQFCATVLSKSNGCIPLPRWILCWFTTFITLYKMRRKGSRRNPGSVGKMSFQVPERRIKLFLI